MQKNPVVFWELASNDAAKSVEFFKAVFDWNINFDKNSRIYFVPANKSSDEFNGGGIFTLRRAKLPFVTIYIQVDDIDSKIKKIEEAGGLIVDAPQRFVQDGPLICLFNDPSGVTFAMLQR